MKFRILAVRCVCLSLLLLCLALAGSACAQTAPTYGSTPIFLHTWTSSESPNATGLALDGSGNIYGFNTTDVNSGGTFTQTGFLYKLTNLQNGSYSYSVPFTFASNYYLNEVGSPVLDAAGDIFGTAFDNNNPSSSGVLFELLNTGSGYSFRIVYTFSTGADAPPGHFLIDANGDLYGASSGGTSCCLAGSPTVNYGAVYEFVNTNGTYTKQILYDYAASNNAIGSVGYLVMDPAGNLFDVGTDANNNFDIVELVRGNGTYTEKLLYSAPSTSANLYYPLTLDANDDIFLASSFISGYADGAVFELVNSGGTYTPQVLYGFSGSADGGVPRGPLTVDAYGNIYGTAKSGGNASGSSGAGTVFALVPGSSGYQLKTLYTFNGVSDGGSPNSGIVFGQLNNIFGIASGLYNNATSSKTPPALFELVNLSGASTTTTLSASPVSAGLATPVTITASVAASTSSYTPAGTVTFSVGSIVLGSAPVTNGVATLIVSSDNLGLGNDTVNASFVASNNNTASNSSGTTTVSVSESNLAQITGGNTFSGNQNVSGTVTATSFSGNGAGLTNVTASALNCVACVTDYQLGVNYAGSSSQGGPANSALSALTAATATNALTANTANTATTATTASNALALGGLPASAYALAGSNSFSGNQTIAGNVTTTGGVTASPIGTATASQTFVSSPLTVTGSAFNSTSGSSEPVGFALEASPVASSNNTANPAATLNLIYLANGTPTTTGFSINSDGTVNFAPNQQFGAPNCLGCITNSQLSVNYAGSSSQGGPATSALTALTATTATTATTALTANTATTATTALTANTANTATTATTALTANTAATASNALQLGGLPASAYALAGTNSFSGNQTITGSVTTTGNVVSGGSVTAASGSFAGGVTSGGVTASPAGKATSTQAFSSTPITSTASVFNSASASSFPLGFALEATPVASSNNTTSPSATLDLIYLANGTPTTTGFSINSDGTLNFASNQKFPVAATGGAGTITAVTAGTGLTGGGTSGNVTVTLAPETCPAGSALSTIGAKPVCTPFASTSSNTFVGQQVMQSLNVTSSLTTNAVSVGGGAPIEGYFSVTIPVQLPLLLPGTCIVFKSTAVTGLTPGVTDTFAIGVPSTLTLSLHNPGYEDGWFPGPHPAPANFLTYQAWETSTAANPIIGLDVCNASNTPYFGGYSGTFRVDIFKH